MFTLFMVLKRWLCSLALYLLVVPVLLAQRPVQDVGNQTLPNRVVYKLKAQQAALLRSTGGNSMANALQQIGARQVAQKFPEVAAQQTSAMARKAAPAVDLSLIYELEYASGHTFEQVKTALMSTGQVAYVEPLYLREPLHQPNDPAADSTKTTQYYLKQVQAYAGWAAEKGDTNIVIGVLDTGFRLSHEDLVSKVKRNYADPVDGVDNDGDGLIDNFSGWDFADGDNNVIDDTAWKGHGTAVAGVAAGATNNGIGMAGMGYNAKFLPLKVFSSYSGGAFGGFEAIVYAANKGCKVINLSWGGTGFSEFEQDVIDYAVLVKDVLIVASGGNTNVFVDYYPASYNHVVSVGGVNNQDVKFRDHTYSYKMDLVSPSVNIYSTSIAGDNRYGNVGGTSFSAPTVAGGAALVRSRYPELNARQVAERLRVSSDDIYRLAGNQAYFEMLGFGRFNLKRALKAEGLKAVRCQSFAPSPLQSLAAGKSVTIDASFINYLAPVSGLQVTLSSLSPYVTVEQAQVNLGALSTMGTATTGKNPFVIQIANNAPANLKVYVRLGFSDGSYQDFQHFELFINPNFATLTANNLHITLNSEGNIGYNGLNLRQGVGVTYKGGSSLLFEGGLMLATESGVVADNLHNAEWQNDRNFKPISQARLYFNTQQADQEIRSLMQTNAEGHPLVEVKTTGYAWSSDPNSDYVILEYKLTNRSADTIPRLHIGLFADWDIGNYTENVAAWDANLQMGYAYHATAAQPYAGIKLLTPEEQILYHAIDNIGGNDSTVTVDDGFSDAEKYKVISNGQSRLRAGGTYGNSISHVLGATALNLAPGQTKTIAFAVLAGHELQALRQHAIAAQQKYRSIRTGPAPVALSYQTCLSQPVVINPGGGSNFNFYADAEARELLSSGQSYTVYNTQNSGVIYVANTDSLYQSSLVPMEIKVVPPAVASFDVLPTIKQIGTALHFQDKSENATTWDWDFGDESVSTAKHPNHTYQKPGTYTVRLTVSNLLECTRSSYEQQISVYDTAPTLYPNPTAGQLTLNLTSPATSALPELRLTDLAGKTVHPTLQANSGTALQYDLSRLNSGVYIAYITYQGQTYVERILVRK